jgi:hypothetical protein
MLNVAVSTVWPRQLQVAMSMVKEKKQPYDLLKYLEF